MLNKGLHWNRNAVVEVNPDANELVLQSNTTGENSTLTYDFLVVAPGVVLRFDKIPGSIEALEDPQSPVCSIYT